jgi:hypothetical protein
LEEKRHEAFWCDDAPTPRGALCRYPLKPILREFAAMQYSCSNFVLCIKKKLVRNVHSCEAIFGEGSDDSPRNAPAQSFVYEIYLYSTYLYSLYFIGANGYLFNLLLLEKTVG